MRLVILVGVILIGFEPQSFAMMRKNVGFADSSCGTWTTRRSDSHKFSYLRAGMESWALGFVSGSNWNSAGKDRLEGIDTDAIFSWIDNYCRQNPLVDF